jgi:hypothetical protein
VPSLVVDSQDGLVCDCMLLIFFGLVVFLVSECNFGLIYLRGSGLVMSDIQKP